VEPKAPADVGQKAVVLEYEEAELLSSLEVLIVKGDEARISLGVLSNMPATTKATPEHKTYEENLAKVKVRGQVETVRESKAKPLLTKLSLCSLN
jgi:hypothetical protein